MIQMTNKMLIEDWLRGCVHHDGKNGYVTLPCDEVMKIADYIESTRGKVEVVRCKDCKHWSGEKRDGFYYFEWCSLTGEDMMCDDFCSYGERGEAE